MNKETIFKSVLFCSDLVVRVLMYFLTTKVLHFHLVFHYFVSAFLQFSSFCFVYRF